MKGFRTGVSAIALCLMTLGASGVLAQTPPVAAQNTPPAALTAEQWRADLHFMADEMRRRHANLYHAVSRETFDAAVADLDRRIPTLQRNEIIVGMMRIAAMVGDGHTRVDPRKDAAFRFPSLPLKLYLFEDGLYIRAAAPERAALVGARIEAIGGVPVEEALRRVAEISSHDNDMGPLFYASVYLNMPDILQALGLSQSRTEATLTLRRGTRRWRASVGAGAVEPLWPPDTDISLVTPQGWSDARTTAAPPTWLAAPLEYHRLVEMPERSALYAQLNMVTNIQGETIAAYGVRIRERAEALNPRAVVLDLRLCFGGNGDLRTGLVRELMKVEDADTRLFVLTARGTFSASQFILDDLDRLTNATFVGEPASSRPSSFGDGYRSRMPNSGINVSTSLLWWQAGQNRSPWTWVDVAAPLTFADYSAGRDPALEAALSYATPAPLEQRFAAAFEAHGEQGLIESLSAYIADPVNRYANVESRLISAEQALQTNKPDAALAMARFVSDRFPQNVDAANVLAFFAQARGDRDAARRASERALASDPNNRIARSMLERLGG